MKSKAVLGAGLVLLAVGSIAGEARADRSVIKFPGRHPDYVAELEPHLVLGLARPWWAHDVGIGAGFRASIEIVDNGFIGSINNTVAIGFGMDFAHYDGWDGYCRRFGGPGPGFRCRDYDVNVLWFPVVMQWNFWLSENWSVFGEPGFAFQYAWITDEVFFDDRVYDNDEFDFRPFIFYAGGRWHFSDNAALTMRIGYPSFSIGVSFLL